MLPAASAATKTRASLLALAICDALGQACGVRAPRDIPARITTLECNEIFYLPPGTWTDDTAMALCLADSLCSLPGSFSDEDQAHRYVHWFQDGYLSATGRCFKIGSSTRVALEIWRGDGGLPQVRHSLDEEWRYWNGCLMKVLLVAFTLWMMEGGGEADEVAMGELAARSSVVTHPHKFCQEACRVYVSLVRMLRAADREEALAKDTCYQFTGGGRGRPHSCERCLRWASLCARMRPKLKAWLCGAHARGRAVGLFWHAPR